MTIQKAVAGLALAGLMAVAATSVGHLAVAATPSPAPNPTTILIDTMETELHRAMSSLGNTATDATQQPKPYFLSYAVSDADGVAMSAQFGAIVNSTENRRRIADVQVRLGTPAEDNTHGDHRNSALMTVPLPLTDDGAALAQSLVCHQSRVCQGAGWLSEGEDRAAGTCEGRRQLGRLLKGKGCDGCGFRRRQSSVVDRGAWENRIRELSGIFKQYPDVFFSNVTLEASTETAYFVSSEGAKVATPNHVARLVIVARTRAADGMDLFRAETFEADDAAHLPDQKTLMDKTVAMAKNLEALREAPVTEPFNGPAILSGRASAVFFHEVLGHRLEGQRQRGDDEGQTFTKLLGKQILPTFLSVSDDPTLATFDGVSLSGHYSYDDEGQPARRVDLIKDGVLGTFLMSRLPIASFSTSNGHGRSEVGHMPTGRQGNLIVTSSKTVSDAELREMLKAEAKKQGKAYGLYFEDISSGFAVTTRRSPQAFQVIPLVVYRVYVDGRPDELVRGVSIVGTPQAALNRILATNDKQDIFNGICGAESGSIPVSAVAPAMLVSEIETQRQAQGTARPPILPPPGTGTNGGKGGQ